MSLLIQMEMDMLRRRPSGDGVKRALQRQKRYAKVFRGPEPTEPRKLLKTGEQFKSNFTLPAEGESFARRQPGISSKSRILGGGRFDYNRPSAGYLYGEK